MIKIHIHFLIFIFAVACMIREQPLGAQWVQIRIHAQPVTLQAGTVKVSDVADISDGDYRLRRQLGSLDLDELSLNNSHFDVSPELIRYRAILAGISDSDFQLVGETTSVHLFDRRQITEKITQDVHRNIASQWQIADEDLQITLISPVETTLLRSGIDLQSLRVEAELPKELPLGQRHLRLQFNDRYGSSLQTTLIFKINYYRDVVMVKDSVSSGQVLEQNDLEVVRRPITETQIRYASFDQVVGGTAQQDLKPFTPLDSRVIKQPALDTGQTNRQESSDLPEKQPTIAKPTTGFQPYDVRRNETVNLVIRQAGLSVTLQNAKAAKNGRIGETMEFINPATNKRIQAKLIDEKTAVRETGP